jgi:hypothetical protein
MIKRQIKEVFCVIPHTHLEGEDVQCQGVVERAEDIHVGERLARGHHELLDLTVQ